MGKLCVSTIAWVTLAAGVAIAPVAEADSVAAWGANWYGESTAPSGEDFVDAAGGCWHSVALRADGTLTAWGDTYYGQCNVPTGDGFVAVASGAWHGLALRSTGTVVAWGRNTYGQCNVPAAGGFVAVAAGGFHSLALREDGVLQAWGCNDRGQCNVPAGKRFVAVAGGDRHTLAITDDGSLMAWGRNDYGQCNVPAGDDYEWVAAGSFHSLALKTDGTLVAWGRNDLGQCDVPTGQIFADMAGGERHTVALTGDGQLLAWGRNDYGQRNVPAGSRYTGVAAGWYHSLALFSVPVEPENHAPVAYDGAVATDEDAPIPVMFEASDADGDALLYGIVTPPLHGTLTGTPPDCVYSPDPNYHGPDSFAFEVGDGLLLSNVATVQIEVRPVNDAPVAVARVNGEAGVVVEEAHWNGTSVTLDAGLSHDIDGDVLSFSWNFTGDGIADAFEAITPALYAVGGPYTAVLTVTDAEGASASDSVTITVVAGPPANQLGNLEVMLADVVAAGQVAPQLEQSLAAKLEAVAAALDKGGAGGTTVALNNLKALLNQVNAQTGKKIDADTAAELVERISGMMTALGT